MAMSNKCLNSWPETFSRQMLQIKNSYELRSTLKFIYNLSLSCICLTHTFSANIFIECCPKIQNFFIILLLVDDS